MSVSITAQTVNPRILNSDVGLYCCAMGRVVKIDPKQRVVGLIYGGRTAGGREFRTATRLAATVDSGVGNYQAGLLAIEAAIGSNLPLNETTGDMDVVSPYVYPTVELARIVSARGSNEGRTGVQGNTSRLVASVGGIGPARS